MVGRRCKDWVILTTQSTRSLDELSIRVTLCNQLTACPKNFIGRCMVTV